MSRARTALAAATLACLPGLAAAQAQPLRHDPFARPSLSAMQPPPAPRAAVAAAPAEETWNPQLIAVMLAGGKSIANLDGIMVRIGATINGWVLAEVRAEEVLLRRGKQRRLVPIRGRGDAPVNAPVNAQEKQ